MLKVENLVVHYGVIPALKGISLEVKEKEIVCLIGANGAGKTTTLNTISGLKKPTSGGIYFQDKLLNNLPAHEIVKLGISQVPEGRGVFPNLSVVENLHLGAYLRKDKSAIEQDLKWVYEIFPRLEERKNQLAGTLSGGEQQMLAIGRALMARPKLMLMDEPSMGLAPIVVEEIFRIIKFLNKEQGTTILLIEQNAQMALAVSHRGYVIETGEIVVSGTAQELKANDEIKKAYLGL
ncbi:MAG TPA: ABC transporter ATP-binding protein [Clostridia bacterium]|nr:ABC transporter ATP-binding protein [Clostridia bacterium]